MICNFLKWRKDNNVNKIRQDIVEHGLDHPLKFPNGELILELIPHIVICPDSCDSFGAPISVDQYNFSPGSVLSKISIEQYIQFVIYSLEYKSLVVEQMSQEREEQYLCSLSDEERRAAESDDDESPPYGVLVNICVVRDLGKSYFITIAANTFIKQL